MGTLRSRPFEGDTGRAVRRLHVTHEKRNLRKHYTALRFNAGGTADNDDDIRPGIQVCIPGRIFMFITVIRPGKKRRKRTWSI